jgi:hypothetical protein
VTRDTIMEAVFYPPTMLFPLEKDSFLNIDFLSRENRKENNEAQMIISIAKPSSAHLSSTTNSLLPSPPMGYYK